MTLAPIAAVELGSERLLLRPLAVEDAAEMVEVLGDEELHEFIGGRPLDADELQARYGALVAGAADPDEIWLNWIVRRRSDGRAVGTVQATLNRRDDRWAALVAWVIGVAWQGQGIASEAAATLVAWLQEQGIEDVAALVHPDHRASSAVAAHAGLVRTAEVVDGEQLWQLPG